MSFVAVAIGGAGLLGAGAAIYSSNKMSGAAKDASQQQTELGRESLAQQNALFERGLGIAQPFIDFGKRAGTTLSDLLTPGPNQTQILSQLPGFQFAQDWGQKAVQNIGSTMGFGGNTLKAGADYATGTAQQGFSGLAQLLLSLTGQGAGAASSAFGNATATGANMGTTLTGIGNATAAGTLGSANALAGGITGAANAGSNALILNQLLKKNGTGGTGSYNGIYSDSNALGTLNATDPGNI